MRNEEQPNIPDLLRFVNFSTDGNTMGIDVDNMPNEAPLISLLWLLRSSTDRRFTIHSHHSDHSDLISSSELNTGFPDEDLEFIRSKVMEMITGYGVTIEIASDSPQTMIPRVEYDI